LTGPVYLNLVKYRALASRIQNGDFPINATDSLIKYNPEFFYTYKILGDYYKSKDQPGEAEKYYERALECEAPSVAEQETVSGQRSAVSGH